MATKRNTTPIGARLTMTYEDAIALTGLDKGSLIDAVLRGDIKAFAPGKETVLLREDIERFVLSRPLETK